MKNKTRMFKYLFKNKNIYELLRHRKINNVVFYRNPCFYRYCHFHVERINPNHVFMVYVVNKNSMFKLCKIFVF